VSISSETVSIPKNPVVCEVEALLPSDLFTTRVRPSEVAVEKGGCLYEACQVAPRGTCDAGGDGSKRAAPAMARHDNDGWWDHCDWVIVGWHWVPAWWGWGWTWVIVCEPDNDWWDDGRDWDDDQWWNDRR
jgi:hypothetical protein